MSILPTPGAIGAVDYASDSGPSKYHCGKCGVLNVKLWREYQTLLNHQSLLCGECSCVEQSKNDKAFMVSGSGRVYVRYTPDPHGLSGDSGDQIGWRVPAVPTADGSTFWGYSSVPDDAVAWWKRLPVSVEVGP